jgi:hypoxanthine phosphoribosyltransferase
VHPDIQRVLYSEEHIAAALERVAGEIQRALAPGASQATQRAEEVPGFTLVAVLKGACVFAADLLRRLDGPVELAFVAASSYRDGTTSGPLQLDLFPSQAEIQGRRLLLVDDILDTGRTLQALSLELLARGAIEVRTCAFLDKPARRRVDLQADFRCFEVEDLFVVGYGLDFAGRYRNLPYVGELRPEVFARAQAAASHRAQA